MKNIKLPNRYYNDLQLVYLKREGDFYVFQIDPNHKAVQYCKIMFDSNKNQIGIDPEGGPFMMVGYKIKKMVIDHFDNEGKIYMKKKTSYKIGAMSDLHGYLPEEVEPCDIICICGDIMPLEIQRDYTESLRWLKENFFPWIEKLPCEKVFVVGGNHDFLIEQISTKAINRICRENLFDKLIYLNNTLAEYDNIRIYGCPNVENLEGWAFYTDNPFLTYTSIPQCDILLTHMPPKLGNMGYIPKYGDLGSEELKKVIETKQIKYAFCGHMHDGNHEWVEHNGCKLKNVALKDDYYRVANPITYCELEV